MFYITTKRLKRLEAASAICGAFLDPLTAEVEVVSTSALRRAYFL